MTDCKNCGTEINKEKPKLILASSRRVYCSTKCNDVFNKWAGINKQRYRNTPIEKYRNKIRLKTYKKYGRLPYGYEYHHTTEPYNADEWLGIARLEHYKFHVNKRNYKKRLNLV